MADFTSDDVRSLEAKLLGLDLAAGESEALAALVERAEQADEVTGFGAITGLSVGGLQFLVDYDKRPGGLLPDGGVFASAGGLGSTRVDERYLGGARGDE